MVLELGRIPVGDIEWGPRTTLEGGVLQVNREALVTSAWGGDSRITSIERK